MSLIEHAERELDLAGLRNEGSIYDGMIGEAVLELVRVFAGQGHSGGSAEIATSVFNEVVRYRPLTPITSNPDEWMDVSAASGGNPMWQSTRNPALFSTDGGTSWYNIDEPSNDTDG